MTDRSKTEMVRPRDTRRVYAERQVKRMETHTNTRQRKAKTQEVVDKVQEEQKIDRLTAEMVRRRGEKVCRSKEYGNTLYKEGGRPRNRYLDEPHPTPPKKNT